MEDAPKYHLLRALRDAEQTRVAHIDDVRALEMGLSEAHDSRVKAGVHARQIEDVLQAADVSVEEIRAAKDVHSFLDAGRAISHVERAIHLDLRGIRKSSPTVARSNS